MIKRLQFHCEFLVWTCWLVAFVGPICAQENSDIRRWALLIGVDDYIEAQDLKFCGADQTALQDHLIASGFPKEQVFLLYDDAKESKYKPFKTNIEKQLDLILGLVEEDDIVVLSFSGHGLHLDNTSYLCPTDADLEDPKSLISLNSIYDRLKQSAASMKVVLVDACRNDPRLGGKRDFKPTRGTEQFARSLEADRPPVGVVLLNSCAPGEVSREDKEFGHGVFMHYLLQGLKGKADVNNNGKISMGELSDYAGRKTKIHVARKFNDSQRPFLKGEFDTKTLDFDISRIEDPEFKLAMKYYCGDGVSIDLVKAYQLFHAAADRGDARAKAFVAWAHFCGDAGIREDEAEANRCGANALPNLRGLAEQGDEVAQLLYGRMLRDGIGTKENETEAIQWFRRSAEKKFQLAYYDLGICYSFGFGVSEDLAQANKWWSKGVEHECVRSKSRLGHSLFNGLGVEKDIKRSTQLLRSAAQKNLPAATAFLGALYFHGDGVEKDYTQAELWLRRAAAQHHAVAQAYLGRMYFEGKGVAKDDSQAVLWWRKAAEQNHVGSQYELGQRFEDGKGVSKDESQAVLWYRKAAEQGDTLGQLRLGSKYYHGEGVEKDYSQALLWYQKAADAGLALAQTELGTLYYYGHGVEKDYSKAVSWFRKAADQKNASSQNWLGQMYYDGNGVAKSQAQAVYWWRKSAEQGDAWGQNALGDRYRTGTGVTRNYSEAEKWYRRALSSSDDHEVSKARKGLRAMGRNP